LAPRTSEKPQAENAKGLSIIDELLGPGEAQPVTQVFPTAVSAGPRKTKKRKAKDLPEASLAAEAQVKSPKQKKGKKYKASVAAAAASLPGEEDMSDVEPGIAERPGARSIGGVSSGLERAGEKVETEQSLKEDAERTLRLLGQVLEQTDAVEDELSEEETKPKDHKERRKALAPESRKIFVGGLPWKVDAETAQEYFEQFGDIDSFNMPTNKQTGKPMGIAFIVYSSADSLEKAVAIDGKNYRGQKLRVRVADPDAMGKDAPGKPKGDADKDDVADKGKGKSKGKDKDAKGKGWGKGGDDRQSQGKGKGKDKGGKDKGKGKGKGKGGKS
ncbi:unnamed protein product, partial [Polarella glacialis]